MPRTKAEYEELLNKLFGTRIRWSRLSLRELEELAERLTSDERCALCEKLQCVTERYPLIEIATSVIPENKHGPLLKLLRKLLEGAT